MEKKNKVDMLNVLRFIAFMMVFLLHTKIFMPVAWAEGVSKSWVLFTPAWAGVWIFFILAGYGIGAGFYNKKYEMTGAGIFKFYLKRISSILPIYWFYLITVFIFIKPELLFPSGENIQKILSLFLFNYQEEFNSLEFGLAWYLTTLMRLYFIAPIAFFFLKKFNREKSIYIVIIVFILLGFLMRIFMGYHIAVTGEGNWSQNIYKPFYFNLDLFLTGFICSGLRDKVKIKNISSIRKIMSLMLLLFLIIYNSYIYFGSSYNGWDKMDIYCYVLPTVYILIILYYLHTFELYRLYSFTELNVNSLKHNITRIFDYFNKIQLPMYLFHSTVLMCLLNTYNDNIYMKICTLFHIGSNQTEFVKGCIFTLEAFLITLVWSIFVHLIIKNFNLSVNKFCSQIKMEKIINICQSYFLKLLQNIFPI